MSKRLWSIILAVMVVLVSMTACNNRNTGNTESGKNDNTSSLPVDNSGDNQGTPEFNDEDSPSITPGDIQKPSPGTNSDYDGEDDYDDNDDEDNGNDNEASKPTEARYDSIVGDTDNLQYYKDGGNYRYGITKAGQEIFSYKDEKGRFVDLVNGGGSFSFRSSQGLSVVETDKVESFRETVENNRSALTVTYSAYGHDIVNASNKTTYIFDNGHIIVQSDFKYENNNYTISPRSSAFVRRFLMVPDRTEKRLSTETIYPPNGDDPYLDREAVAIINHMNDYLVYTFLTSEIDKDVTEDQIPDANLPLFFPEGKNIDCKINYTLVFAKADGKTNVDYLSRFEGRDSEIAVGIAPTVQNNNHSTIFVGTKRDFNINVTNLTENDLYFSLRYDIRDWYGNIIDKDIFINSTVFKNLDANRVVKIDPGRYGVFFINLKVVTTRSSYQDCYTLALLPEHNFVDTTPFGICHVGPLDSPENIKSTINLVKSMGLGNMRYGISNYTSNTALENALLAAQEIKKSGIKLFGLSLSWQRPDNEANYRAWTDENLARFAKYLDFCETGNEDNLASIFKEETVEAGFAKYMNYQFSSGEIVKKYGLQYALASISNSQTQWFDKLYENGLWDKFDIMNIHPYGFPYRPDNKDADHMFWHVESALKRMDDAFKEYGRKSLYISEIGLPTDPGNQSSAGLRTQADYMVRSHLLCMSYGAEWIEWYNLMDFGGRYGMDFADDERYFGVMRYPNYYGIVHPKPSAAAYGIMTRMLDTVNKVEENATYSTGTVRAFNATMSNGKKLIVAWSNIAPLSDDVFNNAKRTPCITWQNQWSKNQNVIFSASGTATVTDIMGNSTTYNSQGGKVTIPLNGSPVYISGVN